MYATLYATSYTIEVYRIYLMQNECLGRQIVKLQPGVFDDLENDKNIIIDLSFDGSFSIYTGFFDSNFVEQVLKKRSDVDFVEKVVPVEANSPIRPNILKRTNLEKRTTQSSAPYNLDRIDQNNYPLDGQYTYPNNAGSESNIYVVDTGIAIENVEFEGRASFGGTFCSNCSTTDDHGHGTNVAGIVGGKNFGVAKKTKLIAVKVLNQNGQGTSATVTAGISFVITKHQNSSNKNTIINLSLSAGFSDAINKIVSDSINAGIHVVASAGDNDGDACSFSPSSVTQAIVVGSTEKNSNAAISSSNSGSCVDIYAPGRDIIAAGIGQTNSLSISSGTSQACPHVAGAIALIISKSGNKTPSTMRNTLVSLAVKNLLTNGANPNTFLKIPAP
ncbi:peptidase S8/S53 domain-containing protein [Glomus cerebriforme]|uniref:Peptidase S8/S53 domain-containing protein n=1 Tax=Glomus cerebriforme TaxID=658196 RepID=A0A397S308_9GLOM|nr:peptidase S8/S53 domain-containing protein [Glomus cerebriforme]